nr:MAG TPA: hypothetical protein [Caudoviricetes sp.]
MIKLFTLILGLLLSVQSNAIIKCSKDNLFSILQYKIEKLQNPSYIQVIKNKKDNDRIPIVLGGNEVYSTTSDIDLFHVTLSEDNLRKLFRSDMVKLSNTNNFNNIVIYPIKDMKRRYITGFLVLGYNSEITNNDNLNISLELVETYLSQILDICNDTGN